MQHRRAIGEFHRKIGFGQGKKGSVRQRAESRARNSLLFNDAFQSFEATPCSSTESNPNLPWFVIFMLIITNSVMAEPGDVLKRCLESTMPGCALSEDVECSLFLRRLDGQTPAPECKMLDQKLRPLVGESFYRESSGYPGYWSPAIKWVDRFGRQHVEPSEERLNTVRDRLRNSIT